MDPWGQNHYAGEHEREIPTHNPEAGLGWHGHTGGHIVAFLRLHWAWVILGVCFLDLFVNYSIRLGFGVILPEMIRDLGLNRTQGGSIFNAYLAAYLCMTPFVGNLTDRYGARRIIAGFGTFLGAGALLMGTADGFARACVYYAIVGVGASAMWTPVLVVVQRWFAPHRRGLALGILSTGYGLGFAAMGWVFPHLVRLSSWRASWYLLGSAALAMVFLNGTLLRSRPEDQGLLPWGDGPRGAGEGEVQGQSSGHGRIREVMSSPRFWLIGASYFLAACSLYLVTTFMVDYAKGEVGLDLKGASFLATIHGLSQVLGVLTIPPLSDRLGRRRTLMGSNFLISIGIVGMVLSGNWTWGLYCSVAVVGMLYGVTWPLYGACGGDYFRKEVMGTVIGAWTPFYGTGAILAHFLAGRVRDLTGSFHWAFLLGAGLALGACVLLWRVGEPNR
jgi:MFS family permease